MGSSRPAAPATADVVHCGAELVGFAERFYGFVFRGMLGLVGVAAVAALALLPLREDIHLDLATTAPIALAGLLVAIVGPAMWRSVALYRLLRRRARARFGLVLVAATLVAHPDLSSGLWWPACACLMLLATVVTMRRVLAGCLVALTANLLGHLVAGDWAQTPPISIVGLWIGLPLWSATVAITTDRLAAHLMGLNARQAPRHPSASRVSAATIPTDAGRDMGGGFERVARLERAPDDAIDAQTSPVAPAFARRIDRLTSRQLEVVALLVDGLRYAEVAACMSISARQVQRHVAEAVARLGVSNGRELVAVAVAENLVPVRAVDSRVAWTR